MTNLDDLRQRIDELPTRTLLREVFINAADFRPEALEVYRAVLNDRQGSLQEIVSAEEELTGETRATLRDVKRFVRHSSGQRYSPGERQRPPAAGDLLLSTGGLGFRARRREGDLSADSIALVMAGPLGWAVQRALDSEQPELAGEEADHLPMSLLGRIDPLSAWIPVDELSWIELKGRLLTLAGEQQATCTLDSDKAPALLAWAEELAIETAAPPREKRSLWQRITGR